MSHCRERRLVDAHFRGRIALAGERRMRAHLSACADCRDHYERHLLLATIDPAAPSARDRLARGLGLTQASSWWARPLVPALGLAVLLVVVLAGRPPTTGARGPAHLPGSQLIVYELAQGRPPEQAIARIGRDSGLAFAYANLGHRRRLSVFAVDEGGRVYWYHPAWNTPDEDPVGVPLAGDERIHEIPQVIHQQVAGPRLQIFAVFADRPISVREVEAAVARAPRDREGRRTVSLEGGETTRLDLDVVDGP
jgi:hypothetical protein